MAEDGSYGGENLDAGEMDGDFVIPVAKVSTIEEVEERTKRLKAMADEAASLRAVQAEVDSRSVFVGNVEYACTPEEVLEHFKTCGTINRVTIRKDQLGQPKGFAYVEFAEAEAIQKALQLNGSVLHGREIKVLRKRTNLPGYEPLRYRQFKPYMA